MRCNTKYSSALPVAYTTIVLGGGDDVLLELS